MFFGLVHHTRHAVLLEGVDPVHPLVAHRVQTKGGEVQTGRNDAVENGCYDGEAVRMGHDGQSGTNPAENCGQHLARQGRAARDLACVIGGFGAQAAAQQPCRQSKRRRTQQGRKQGHSATRKASGDQHNCGHKQQICPPACRIDFGPALAFVCCLVARRIGAIFAAELLCHAQTPPSQPELTPNSTTINAT